MRKFKRLLFGFTAVFMAFALCFSVAACNVDEGEGDNPVIDNPVITTELIGIDVNTDKVKKEYYKGDSFTSSGLVVTATTKRSDRDTTTESDVTARAVIDSTAYRRARVGTYEIFVSYTLGEVTKQSSYKVNVNDLTLELNTVNVKNEYFTNETDPFSAEGLTVTATTIKPGNDYSSVDVTNDVSIDYSAFNHTKVGVYPIVVNYESASGIQRSASFNVTVSEPKEGLRITLNGAVSNDNLTQDTIELSASSKTGSFDPTKIIVESVDKYGEVDRVLSADEYDMEVYRGTEKITSYTNLGEGAYQIWVSKDAEIAEDYVMTKFATIYIVDTVVSFARNESVGKTTQDIGVDEMSSTWTYTLELAASGTKTLTAKDVTVDGINTLSPNSGRATVTYVYKNAKGEATNYNVNVDYTVEQGNKTQHTSAFSYSAISGKSDGNALAQTDLTGANSFLTLAGGTVNYRGTGTDNGVLEIRGDGLKVTFQNVGTLTLTVRSTGASNLSSIGVKDANGNYISGEQTGNVDKTGADKSDTDNTTVATPLEYANGIAYQVTGTNFCVITFTITKPGTYTIFTSDMDPEGTSLYGRNTRLKAISMIDIY